MLTRAWFANMGVEFLEFANKPNMGALPLKIQISQIWGHIVSWFLQVCPHIWLIRILSESAPVFGLFIPIIGLFINSKNSTPIFGLFGSKFAVPHFWPDGTTWYRRIKLPWLYQSFSRVVQSVVSLLARIVPSLPPTCESTTPPCKHKNDVDVGMDSFVECNDAMSMSVWSVCNCIVTPLRF